ncbi:amp dependent CoA ligase [Irpex rosettiformis]|uniref:Amp dependent CoA ligase n=1 Tax=Irpex rosettiformis TaxID=378272 RepID=A0ACB8ULT4_9APHY|nr:amp dependent CoA ligase [Irpex rosettiformis]
MSVTEFTLPSNLAPGPLPHIPDNLTLPQFILDAWHPNRPVNTHLNPVLIEDSTGRGVGLSELRARTFGLANEMRARWNIGENDVVCIFSPNHVDYPVALWAAHRLGAIVTTANPAYTADELVYQLNLTKASVIFTHSSSLLTAEKAAREAGLTSSRVAVLDSPEGYAGNYSTLDRLVAEGLSKLPTFEERRLNPGEGKTKIALLNFSSGTTGKPKAVAIAHYAVMANVIQMAHYGRATSESSRRYRPGQVVLAALPFYHIYGLIVVMHFYTFVGFSLVIMPKFSLEGLLDDIQRFRINHLLLVPPMIVLLAKNPIVTKYDLASVTMCMSGAAPLSAELTSQYCERIPTSAIGQGYGMTETATTLTFPRIDVKVDTLGSGGQLLAGNICRILKADGKWAGYNEPGELIVKGPTAALCYFNNPEATKETFLYFDGKPDRWVRTGDEVKINEIGEVFVVDRMKEILKVRGFQVAPAELEGHLLGHPDVADCCVVGIPDEYSGEVPLAFVVPSHAAQNRMNSDPQEAIKVKESIVKFVHDHKVHYKRLTGGVEFLDSIPKNPSGKLLRRFLREKAKEILAARTATATSAKSKAKL